MTAKRVAHVFVDTIPDVLNEGVLYISVEFRTTMHLCACGCGEQVVLPLRPAAWSMTYNGEHISMSPSIGNWSFPCRSHYWIRSNGIEWAGPWSDRQVDAGRKRALDEREAAVETDIVAGWSRRWHRLRSWLRRVLQSARNR